MGERIRALITQAEHWRDQHARAGNSIDAAACAIRIRALQDALKIVEAGRP
ncbi:hypothetical protein LPC10_01940 [Methylorubrum sp. B1-46]|uniref:hypothetical protein n=1 Tax=Methylorubrum sp. B1-46 TaxID=2897334 RepID=UPI001E5263E4|nr:hypothetical protein [Methylorubrum sp. B1-46]UGB26402.1 hypothetical protein LPC10_01940 [Methylorubrum sp. B1-46]